MIGSEKDTEDTYSDLDSLITDNPENSNKYFTIIPPQQQQQSFYEVLQSDTDDIKNYKPDADETPLPPPFEDMIDSVMHTILSRIQPIQCTRCKVKKTLADFGVRKNGERMKICRRCTTARKIGIIMTLYKRQRKYSTKS